MRLPLRGDRGGARRGGPRVPRGLPVSSARRTSWARTARIRGNTLDDAQADRGGAGARRPRLPVHLARRQVRGRAAAAGRARRCTRTPATAARCASRAGKGDPPGVNTLPGHRHPRGGARRRLHHAGGRLGQDLHLRAGGSDPARGAGGPHRHGAGAAGRSRPARASGGRARTAAARTCVFCPYCEEEDQHHRTVTCTLWPKDPANHRQRLDARRVAARRALRPEGGLRNGPALARIRVRSG